MTILSLLVMKNLTDLILTVCLVLLRLMLVGEVVVEIVVITESRSSIGRLKRAPSSFISALLLTLMVESTQPEPVVVIIVVTRIQVCRSWVRRSSDHYRR